MLETLLYLAGVLTALVSAVVVIIVAIFHIRKLWGWLFPVRVEPKIYRHFDDSVPDEIQATLTNRSLEPVYVVKCRGRSANSMGYIIRTHLRNPLIKPRLYDNVRFGAPVFEMINLEPVRIEPSQQVELSHRLSFRLPISGFANPMVQIEVVLSNSRILRSRRLSIPQHWHVLHRKKKPPHEKNNV